MKVSKVISAEVRVEGDLAYCEECPFRGIDGGPSPAMVCEHPNATDTGYIISWDDKAENRISKKCPILGEKK